MSIQNTILFSICIALAIPLLISSTLNHELQEIIEDANSGQDQFEESSRQIRQPYRSLIYNSEPFDKNHFILRKAADFEEILKPCNRMPASGRGREYADCVRNRMLLMGRRKRRQAN